MTNPRPLQDLRSLEDTIEECMADFGWAELMQALLVSFASFFDAQQTFMNIYADAQPSFHCLDQYSICDPSRISTTCHLPNSSWAWDGQVSKTIVSEWNLQCSSSFLVGLPASSYFVGCVLGGLLLATLADSKLGRKNLLLFSCFTMSLTSLSIRLSTNLYIYAALRLLSGFGRSSIGTCTLVLLTERVGKKYRARVGMMQFFFFTLGFLSLPGIAYLNRSSSWRNLYVFTSVPGILYCFFVFFFVNESPRWLFMQGRGEEAVKVLKKFATANRSKLDSLRVSSVHAPPLHEGTTKDSTIDISSKCSREEVCNQETNIPNPSATKLYSSMKDLFVKRWALKRIIATMVLGFGIGMVYYGMPMGVGNLGFDIYLSVVFNAALEIPSYLVTFVLLDKWNRRGSLFTFCLVSGICGIMCAVVVGKKVLQIGLELASFFLARTAYNVLLIYTVELFPTCVRNSATSMVRQALVLGAVFSPMLVSVGRNNKLLSFGVFGSAILVCGFFVVFLPETRGATLCDTMEQQERKENTATTLP